MPVNVRAIFADEVPYRLDDPESGECHVVHEVLRDFASGTSLNGIPRIINARSARARVFWSVVFVGAFGMFLWTCSNLLNQYSSYPTKVGYYRIPR